MKSLNKKNINKSKSSSASHGIRLKKKFGQHFLQNPQITHEMIQAVELKKDSSVFEIGCGDGFLTNAILETEIERLWVFEIDGDWAKFVQDKIKDSRLTIFNENFLNIDFKILEPNKPWTVLSNLPYQVTFPIVYKFIEHRSLISEGVIMVQEEVAQKIVKTYGRGYGFNSLYLQHYADWKLLVKVPPKDFYPPPKVNSRLLYFKPKKDLDVIECEQDFWVFIKKIFSTPRRTIRNNMKSCHYNLTNISEDILDLRAQQLSKNQLIEMWHKIII